MEMTTAVTKITSSLAEANAQALLPTVISVVVTVLLLVLLVQKELVRAFGGPRASQWMQALNIVIVPLLLAFAVILLIRLVNLTGFGVPVP